MKFPKPSQLLAFAGWSYVFGSAILVILRVIPVDGLTWSLFGLFLFIAFFASAVASGKRKIADNDIRVNIAGSIFTGDALDIHELRNGSIFIYVDLAKPLGPDAHVVQAPPKKIRMNVNKKK